MKQTYVFRDGQIVPKSEAPANTGGFFFVPDIKPFVTMEGVPISSRSALREYERKNGVKQVGNDFNPKRS